MTSSLRASFLTLIFLSTAQSAFARDINLPPERVSICVGKTGVVMNTKTQLDELIVNNTTSRQTTFNYRGRNAIYTCDFDAGDSIVGRCSSVGTQTLNTVLAFKYADLNTYRVAITVECKLCPLPPRPVPIAPYPGPIKPVRPGLNGRG